MTAKNRSKGNRNQRKCIEELEAKGYLVDKVEKTGKFTKQKDLFGLFDLIGIHKKHVTFVQVTTNRPHTHKDYIKFGDKYKFLNIEQWVWYDRKGWKIFNYNLGIKRVFDLRK